MNSTFGIIPIRIQLEIFLFVCVLILAFALQRILRVGMLKAKFGMIISRDSNPIVYWAYVGMIAFVLLGGIYALVAVLIGSIPVE